VNIASGGDAGNDRAPQADAEAKTTQGKVKLSMALQAFVATAAIIAAWSKLTGRPTRYSNGQRYFQTRIIQA